MPLPEKKGNQVIHIQLGKRQYALFYIGAICTYMMILPVQVISRGDISNSIINICGFFISLACIVFLTLILWQGIIVYREQKVREENRMYEQYMTMQEEHYRQLMERDEKMRRFRHDMNAHLAVIKAYSSNCNNRELDLYLQDIIHNSAIDEFKSYTGNKVVDTVIDTLIQEVEEGKINFSINGLIPQDTYVRVYDLCTIVYNLLKNAIEECEKIEEVEKRQIIMNITPYNEQLIINVRNKVKKEIIINNNQLVSTKADFSEHGMGSKNVASTVRKYKGDVQYHCENGWFTAEIVL